MAHERHYSEQEIAEIFKRAAAAQESDHQHPSTQGLTLTEIEAIGREAGIAPDYIARAAATLGPDTTTPPPQTFLGIPYSVDRSLDLPQPFSEGDWDHLVADLHETFGVFGEIRHDAPLRRWTVPGLEVIVESTPNGDRLHIKNRHVNQQGTLFLSTLTLVMGLMFIAILAAKGTLGVDLDKTLFVSLFAAFGIGGLCISALRLPRWRAERAERIDALIDRTLARLTDAPNAKAPPVVASETIAAPLLDTEVPAPTDERERTAMRPRSRG